MHNVEIYEAIKKNHSAGDLYRTLISEKSLDEKIKNLEEIINYASIKNSEIAIRIKCLGFIKFLKEMSIDPIWNEGIVINRFTDIEFIIEQNILDILEEVNSKLKISDVYSLLCKEILTMTHIFTINKELFYKFKSTLFNVLDLTNKYDQNNLSLDEEFLYNIFSINSKKYDVL